MCSPRLTVGRRHHVQVRVDPVTYRGLRLAAAARGTTVSALVRDWVRELVEEAGVAAFLDADDSTPKEGESK
jgi:hypothetical protein